MESWVDVSALGAGACLRQWQKGKDRVIAYAFMTFNAAQKNYSTIDRQLTTLRWSVKSFQSFLYGVEFILKTNNQPLAYLHNMRLVDGQLARTLKHLADFNFSNVYVPGKTNIVADALSQLNGTLTEQQSTPQELPDQLCLDDDPVPGEGDSLFLSLLRCLQSNSVTTTSKDEMELRRVLIDELLRTPEKYKMSGNRYNWKRELRLMRHSQQLPCLEVLLAASFLFRLSIFVYF